MSPAALAKELGIDAKALRSRLRATYPRPLGQRGAAWQLTSEQVHAARVHWSGKLRAGGRKPR